MSTIKHIWARQILDSRGNPTVEVDVELSCGSLASAAVPSGASTGSREALELRDGDKTRFLGKGVSRAVNNINKEIAPKLVGMNPFDQHKLDYTMIEMDGTENKEKLGANAILGVSMAVCRAAAMAKKKPLYQYLFEDLSIPNPYQKMILPAPLMNIINGGAHASNNLDIQEFMIVPNLQASFSENLRAGVEVFHALKKVLSQQGFSTNVGDEGGFAPDLKNHVQACDLIQQAVESAGYQFGKQIYLSLDAAASEFYDASKKRYTMGGEDFSSDQMVTYYEGLQQSTPLYSLEDGLDESDIEGWKKLNLSIGQKCLTVGDDLFVTNKKILKRGIDGNEANSILIKVNQIGSLTETFETLDLAFKNNMKAIISHRSGETADSFIADLAVACGAGHIKTGSASRTDRIEKYNQLMRIEEKLGKKAEFYNIN